MSSNYTLYLSRIGISSPVATQTAFWEASPREGGLMLLAPTGSGKTVAFMLPLIEAVDASSPTLQAVVITPTRELARQHLQVMKQMQTPIASVALHGGRSVAEEQRTLQGRPVQVVFATPGRLTDHLRAGSLSGETVRLLVIDEFDKCLSLGFHDEMGDIVASVPAVSRLWLTSATELHPLPRFAARAMTVWYTLNFLEAQREVLGRMEITGIAVEEKQKKSLIHRLLLTLEDEQSLVFVGQRATADDLYAYLKAKGHSAVCYHGGLAQERRQSALFAFRSKSTLTMICTDLGARGLDFEHVASVIHYDAPESQEDFTHRCGRTARFDATGTVYLLVTPSEISETAVPFPFRTIPATNLPEPPSATSPQPAPYGLLYVSGGKRDKISKGDLVGFFCRSADLQADALGLIEIAADHSLVAVKREWIPTAITRADGGKVKKRKVRVFTLQ